MDFSPDTMMWLEIAVDVVMIVALWRIQDRLVTIIGMMRVRNMRDMGRDRA